MNQGMEVSYLPESGTHIGQHRSLRHCFFSPYNIKGNERNGILGHNTEVQGYTGPWTTWANEMNFVMNMPLVQDPSLDLLSSSPAHYHSTTERSSR